MAEFDTDTTIYNNGHNILETKAILLAFAASKLTKDFPNNLRVLDITLAFSMKEKRNPYCQWYHLWLKSIKLVLKIFVEYNV